MQLGPVSSRTEPFLLECPLLLECLLPLGRPLSAECPCQWNAPCQGHCSHEQWNAASHCGYTIDTTVRAGSRPAHRKHQNQKLSSISPYTGQHARKHLWRRAAHTLRSNRTHVVLFVFLFSLFVFTHVVIFVLTKQQHIYIYICIHTCSSKHAQQHDVAGEQWET